MDFFNHITEDERRETLANRRQEVLEFGEGTDNDSEIREFELCKGLICVLD